jgi:hypothetical protein
MSIRFSQAKGDDITPTSLEENWWSMALEHSEGEGEVVEHDIGA